MNKLLIVCMLGTMAGGGTACCSPRGVEFSTDVLLDNKGVVISFSSKGDKGGGGGTCYSLINPMGKTAAVACLSEDGWSLHGGEGWVFNEDGGLTVRFDEDPKISRIYPDDAGRVKAGIGEVEWMRVNPGDLVEKAKKACEGKLVLPLGVEASVSTVAGGYGVVFLGKNDGGESFSPGMVLIERETGKVVHVAAP